MVLNIDVTPTLLSLAGVPVPESMQGRDLSPLLAGKAVPWRDEFFYELRFPHPTIPMCEGVRTAEYMYWRYLNVDHDVEWMYDLKKDPYEVNNLAADPAQTARLAEMRTKVDGYRKTLAATPPQQ